MLNQWLATPRVLLSVLSMASMVSSAPLTALEDATAAPAAVVLSSSEVNAFKPYASLAGAGYCPLTTWSCGVYCDAAPGFQLTAKGGDGGSNPYWYVGYAPSLGEIIVGHQGTNSSNSLSVLNNLDIVRKPLPQALFPGVPTNATAHGGFLATAVGSGPSVLAAVKAAAQSSGSKKVVIVGHSLGAATATLHAIYLKLQLDATISVRVVGFAAPRVGNPAFATLTDSLISDLRHINNKRDPVPILPGRGLGYQHPNGEVHITSDGSWYSCPSHDTTVASCTIATVPNLLVSDVNDHYGPYVGVYLGSNYCK